MKTKIKYFKIAIPVVILLVAAIILPIFVCRSTAEKSPLSINTVDMTLVVNEEKKLTYELSNSNAVVSISVKEKGIVQLIGNKLFGLQKGKTQIELTANFGKETAKCVSNIFVVADDEPILPPIENPDDKDSDETENPDTDGETEEPSEPSEPQKPNFNFQIVVQDGCTVSENTIYIKKGMIGFFRLEFANLESSSPELYSAITQIKKIPIGCNTWQIIANISDKIFILLNGEKIGELNIEVI